MLFEKTSIKNGFDNINANDRQETIEYEVDFSTPKFTFRSDQTGLDRFNISGLASRWSMLLGLRYMFN